MNKLKKRKPVVDKDLHDILSLMSIPIVTTILLLILLIAKLVILVKLFILSPVLVLSLILMFFGGKLLIRSVKLKEKLIELQTALENKEMEIKRVAPNHQPVYHCSLTCNDETCDCRKYE
jgi:hypothetical protein